MSLLET